MGGERAVVLAADGLTVAYGGNTALRLQGLQVREGEVVGVVGANGAGKSTLVNALAGWSRGSPRVTGNVALDGRDIGRLPPHDRARAGLLLVPEGKLVFAQMTVDENLSPPVDATTGDGPGRRRYTRDEVFALLRRMHAEVGTSFLIVTHDPRLAERCDRTIELVDGRVSRDTSGPAGLV